MQKTVLKVDGMSCEHCVRAIQKAVGALPGTGGASVDLKAKSVTVEYDSSQVSLEQIRLAIEDQGYDII
jgi:copper chaperone